MTDLYEYAGADELVSNDWPVPFTMVPVWLLLAGCTAQAYRMYAFLAAHLQSTQKKPGERIVCPKQTAIAHVMGLKNPRQVGAYGRELQRLGALQIQEYRYAGEMRRGYRYNLFFNPPAGFAGPMSLGDFYDEYKALRFAPTPGRVLAANEPERDGGTKNSTSGGTENSTTGGTENSTTRGATDGTSRGPMDGTAHGPTDGRAHGPLGSSTHGATDGSAHETKNSTAELDVGELDVEERETSPSSVVTAEERASARAEEQKGAASPHDLSPAAAADPDGASPDDGSSWENDAPTAVEARHVAMARDVLARLPRWLAPGDQIERTMALEVISAAIARGYTPALVTAELTANPVEHVANKPAFIAARLRRMSPPIPPQRPVDRAAVDEIRGREAVRADDEAQRQGAAAARAAMRRRQDQGGGDED